ncbi:MAG: hypothetical protein KIS85_06230 [Anaerolineales bacterium]|nr:hypothetical protein [Anaerolineales bacterium]
MPEAEFTLSLYNPRYNQHDTLAIRAHSRRLRLSRLGVLAQLSQEGANAPLVWEAPIDDLVTSCGLDNILLPMNFVPLVIDIWQYWRDAHLAAPALQVEYQALFEWINAFNARQPRTPYWQRSLVSRLKRTLVS